MELKSVYGKLAYADGKLVKIVRSVTEEDADGFKTTYVGMAIKVDGSYYRIYGESNVYEKVTFIDSITFESPTMSVTTAIISADGKTKVGYSICAPEDVFSEEVGQRIALMRAFNDTDGIRKYLEELDPNNLPSNEYLEEDVYYKE